MFNFSSPDPKHDDANLETGLSPEAHGGHHQPQWRQGWWRQGRALARAAAVAAGAGAVVAALAVPAAASGPRTYGTAPRLASPTPCTSPRPSSASL